MDELTSWLKAENLSDCAPYLQGLSMLQVISLASLPTALVDEKPKLAKKLKSAIKAYKKSTILASNRHPTHSLLVFSLQSSFLPLLLLCSDIIGYRCTLRAYNPVKNNSLKTDWA